MTADQLWQTLVIVAAVAVTVFGASWRLSNVLEAVRGSVSALKLEMQQDVAQVRSDRKSTRLNSSHSQQSRMPSSA